MANHQTLWFASPPKENHLMLVWILTTIERKRQQQSLASLHHYQHVMMKRPLENRMKPFVGISSVLHSFQIQKPDQYKSA